MFEKTRAENGAISELISYEFAKPAKRMIPTSSYSYDMGQILPVLNH
jgi:hypothetical protein